MSKNTFKDRGFSDQKLALLASLLEKEGVPLAPRQPSWSALTPIRAGGTKPPRFCMHGAGGTVLMYRDLSRHLGDDQPFYGLQSQGPQHAGRAIRRALGERTSGSFDSALQRYKASSSGERAVNALQLRRS